MTSITFYFNAGDRVEVACRLAAKAMQQGKRVLVYAPAPEVAQRFDRQLWTTPATSFVPHCAALAARGVKFEVCEITLKTRGLNKDQFLAEAEFTPSGVVRIAKLQQAGAAYIKP
mgnify:CR=1 FL=1